MISNRFSELLTRVLHSDERARDRLAALGPCRVRLAIEPFASVGLDVRDGEVRIVSAPAQADLEVRATAGAFARYALTGRPADIHFSGDAERAQELRDLLGVLDIDWEGLAAEVVGDTAARALGRTARAAARGARTVARAAEDNARDYLYEESGLLATHEEVARFVRDVDCLRDDAERLEARLRRLGA